MIGMNIVDRGDRGDTTMMISAEKINKGVAVKGAIE